MLTLLENYTVIMLAVAFVAFMILITVVWRRINKPKTEYKKPDQSHTCGLKIEEVFPNSKTIDVIEDTENPKGII